MMQTQDPAEVDAGLSVSIFHYPRRMPLSSQGFELLSGVNSWRIGPRRNCCSVEPGLSVPEEKGRQRLSGISKVIVLSVFADWGHGIQKCPTTPTTLLSLFRKCKSRSQHML